MSVAESGVHANELGVATRVRRTRIGSRRGWLLRRLLVVADVVGLAAAVTCAELLYGDPQPPDRIDLGAEIVLFVLTLPVWLLGGKLFGLYDRDEERADHSTSDELARVFLLITVGVFLVTRTSLVVDSFAPDVAKLTAFWAFSIVFVTAARTGARTLARRSRAYLQNTLIVGAGEVGQRVARKLLQHREYGINLVGFVDDGPRERAGRLEQVPLVGGLDQLLETVERADVDRVVIAFSRESHERFLPLIRVLRDSGVQVDLVPRLFEVMGPKVDVHTIEALPLLGLAPVKLPRSSQALKRAVDVVGAGLLLVLFSPLLAVIAAAVRLDSAGPVLFRQTRLGKDMRPFTVLKFRTMRTGTDDTVHREYIAATMDRNAQATDSGLYKLSRDDAVTRVGGILRRASLDELPQLLNVVRGDMSLVGPRPCIPYEVERFEPHHFERFLVPAGLTGLWQTSARAHSTFGEALDLDVLYAQSWSLGLDFVLLARTPLQLFRSGQTA